MWRDEGLWTWKLSSLAGHMKLSMVYTWQKIIILMQFSKFFLTSRRSYITIDELQQDCTEFSLCDTPLDDMIRENYLDNDEKIDFSKFTAMMKKGDGGGRRRTMMRNT